MSKDSSLNEIPVSSISLEFRDSAELLDMRFCDQRVELRLRLTPEEVAGVMVGIVLEGVVAFEMRSEDICTWERPFVFLEVQSSDWISRMNADNLLETKVRHFVVQTYDASFRIAAASYSLE